MMIWTNLAYVALVVTDASATAAVLARDFGLPRTDCALGSHARVVPVVAVGQSALALFQRGDPSLGDDARPGVHHLAMEVLASEDAW